MPRVSYYMDEDAMMRTFLARGYSPDRPLSKQQARVILMVAGLHGKLRKGENMRYAVGAITPHNPKGAHPTQHIFWYQIGEWAVAEDGTIKLRYWHQGKPEKTWYDKAKEWRP